MLPKDIVNIISRYLTYYIDDVLIEKSKNVYIPRRVDSVNKYYDTDIYDALYTNFINSQCLCFTITYTHTDMYTYTFSHGDLQYLSSGEGKYIEQIKVGICYLL